MIKKLFFTIAILFLGTLMFANTVTMDVAQTVATTWYKHYKSNGVTDFSISDSYETKYNGVTTFYTFIFTSGGFVMVPSDDVIIPIIGYSIENGVSSRYNIPENAQAFFDDYSREIIKNIDAGSSNAETIVQWNQILNEQFNKSPMAVAAMCATLWDQGSPYSNNCPAGVPTGCVATGMSQIMKKWNYPTTGIGSHTYTSAYAGPLTANFGATTYDWANMTNTYSAGSSATAKAAVAKLMSHAGISVDMNYAPAGSGAYNTAVAPALISYFGYQPSAEAKTRSLYPTDALWLSMIKAEMDQGRPCMLAGDDGTGAVGHEFVCDGYNASLLFHINWGWSGSFNGFFSLTALNPSSYNFSSNRQATIRIRPLSGVVPIANFTASNTIPAIAAPVDFTDNSLNSPTSWLWTFDGGTPATSTLQNPTGVTFATNGYHVISLTATNAGGSDIKTKERYIKVGGAPTVWIRQNSSFTSSSRGIDEIDIIDANTVWAKGYNGSNPTGYIREFTRTNDGGTTWTPGTIAFTGSTNFGVSNLYSVDYMTAYASMFPITGTGGTIVKTTDGGATWAIQASATFTNSWADFVNFFDANNGVAVGDPTATTASDFVIYTTSDGGATWTQVSTASLPNSLANEAGIVNLYSAVGNTIWFATNKGRMYKSTDKGATWTVNTTGFPASFNMKFKDANNGIAVSDTLPYDMKKTINGGTTWTALAPTGFLVKRPVIAYVPGTASRWHNVASFPSNGSSYSIDDCASMMNIDTGSVQFTAVSFFDANTGWAGSFNVSPTLDGIYKWNPSVLSTTGINEAEIDNVFVYPVPARNIVNIQFGKLENENIAIDVFNMVGEKVISKQIKVASNDVIQLDMSDKDVGLYFVNIQNGSKTITKKITIVR
jgi:PKD repeat protein